MEIQITVSGCTPDQAGAIAAFLKNLGAEHQPAAQVDRIAEEVAAKMYPAAPSSPTPPPAAPAAAPAPTPPPAAPKAPPAGELDSRGVPWHVAHHATTKGKNQDGTWKRLKGTDKNVVAAYEAQFTNRPTNAPASNGGVPAATPSAPPTIQPAAPVDTSAGVPIHTYTPPAPPAAPVMAPPAPPAPPVDYGTFYTLYIALCEATALTEERVKDMHAVAGVTDVNQYNTDPEKRALGYRFMQNLQQQLAA